MFAFTRLISRKVMSSHRPPKGRVPKCTRPDSSGSSWSRDFASFFSHHRTKSSIAAFVISLHSLRSIGIWEREASSDTRTHPLIECFVEYDEAVRSGFMEEMGDRRIWVFHQILPQGRRFARPPRRRGRS